ncbi:XRE family transcriptional regulator [Streptomyces sp. NPDC047072]|uniref:XRE family transcriptional regulator n=1 Tax=Streptomyces sp. NPDC047072 TaxID=3154809 RepID=UPI0033DC20F2
MPGGTQRTKSPKEYVTSGEWPYAELEEYRPARVAQHVARTLKEAMTYGEISAKALGRASEVNRQCIANVLHGRVWPDLLTVASLEETLQTMLWPLEESPAG